MPFEQAPPLFQLPPVLIAVLMIGSAVSLLSWVAWYSWTWYRR